MYDYHSHTFYSADSITPMSEMIETACRIGLKELAITDHYDPDYPIPFNIDLAEYHKALDKAKENYKDRIKILKGVEIGLQPEPTLKLCSQEANSFDYDFIIGSFHCLLDREVCDPVLMENYSFNELYLSFYATMRNVLTVYKDYDVIGHFNVIDRHIAPRPAESLYMDIVEDILKVIIEDGKGIEINTSSFRYGLEERTTPAKEILKLYKDLGGEIITIGSDAHRPADLGHRFGTGVEMIRATGLKYLATYDQRKVSFVKLDTL